MNLVCEGCRAQYSADEEGLSLLEEVKDHYFKPGTTVPHGRCPCGGLVFIEETKGGRVLEESSPPPYISAPPVDNFCCNFHRSGGPLRSSCGGDTFLPNASDYVALKRVKDDLEKELRLVKKVAVEHGWDPAMNCLPWDFLGQEIDNLQSSRKPT